MNSTAKKIILSCLTSGLVAGAGLVVLLLNPAFLYAHQTATPHYTIYHNQPLDPALLPRLAQARALVQQSAWFDSTLKLNLCLNDGSAYPGVVEKLLGPAFGWSVYHSVVLSGKADWQANYEALNGYKWNLVQLLAHEATHCYQLRYLGVWRMNPLVRHYPTWKTEGYAEYVARRGDNYPALRQQVQQLQHAEHAAPGVWGIMLADSTNASREYATYLSLTAYCLDIKRLTYSQLLADTTSEQVVHRQVLSWYQQANH